MATIQKGVLTIETDADNQKRVFFTPVNNTVWLTKDELLSLFETGYQYLHTCINDIVKNNSIDIEKTSKYHTIINTSRKKAKYELYEFTCKSHYLI